MMSMFAIRNTLSRQVYVSNHVLTSCSSCSFSKVHLPRNTATTLQSRSSLQNTLNVITPAVTFYQPSRNAGHSKWANIRHVKTANDMAKSKELTKFMNCIKVAVKENGSADPSKNTKLAQVIAQIKAAKLPMGAVDRALQSFSAKKDSQSSVYPVRGPGGSVMIIELEAQHMTRSKQELNAVLKKHKSVVLEDSIMFMFDHRGILLTSGVDGKPASEELLDDATMHAIDVGANDVSFIKDHPEFGAVFEFTTEPSAFLKTKFALEERKYDLVHAEVVYQPKKYVELEDDDIEIANKLYEKLTAHPDVTKVHANIA